MNTRLENVHHCRLVVAYFWKVVDEKIELALSENQVNQLPPAPIREGGADAKDFYVGRFSGSIRGIYCLKNVLVCKQNTPPCRPLPLPA